MDFKKRSLYNDIKQDNAMRLRPIYLFWTFLLMICKLIANFMVLFFFIQNVLKGLLEKRLQNDWLHGFVQSLKSRLTSL